MDWSDYDGIKVIAGILSGVPLLKGTRVPADLVIGSLDGGKTVDKVAYNVDLKPEDVRRLKQYRNSHRIIGQTPEN